MKKVNIMCDVKMFSIVCLLLLLAMACKEHQITPVSDDDTPPSPVSNVRVENLPGKAILTYDLPDNNDLLYVKAEYVINPQGTAREGKASFYHNTLTVNGFATAEEYEVKLYAVDRSENVSEPVSVTVHPETPPIMTVFESLSVIEDFGGINVAFTNEAQADVVISIMTKDSLEEWISASNFYTSRPGGNFSVRGYEAVERTFGIYVRDRWDNRSDTLITTLVPKYEELLDKDKFDEYELPGDAERYSGSWDMPEMWDGIVGDQGYHTSQDPEDVGFPLWNTIDLGVTAKLSRFKFWDRQDPDGGWMYTHGNIKRMELWGSNDPDPDGDFDGWTKLVEVEAFKPSGLPPGATTSEDRAYAEAGQEFNFPADIPAVRYIRLKVIESWTAPPNSPNGFFHLSEISFWGQIEE